MIPWLSSLQGHDLLCIRYGQWAKEQRLQKAKGSDICPDAQGQKATTAVTTKPGERRI